MRGRSATAAAVVVTSLLVSLVIAEGGLRLLGRRSWQPIDGGSKETVLHEPDGTLGWVNKPGHYLLPPHLPGGPDREVTVLGDHSRSTGTSSAPDVERVDLVGCSVTNGYGLSDADTFGWKLQQNHPELRFVNFGTAAYGTYQSMLRMEKILSRKPPPRLILYGFITQHEARNVATYDWLRGLALNAGRGHVAPPYVTLGAGDWLERHAPESFAIWPLADRLVLVRMADDAYMHFATRSRASQGAEATKRLIGEMARKAREHSVAFAVVFLLSQDGRHEEYVEDFERNDIRYVDCVRPLDEKSRIPGEGHPNGALNTAWAECISEKLPDLVRR